MSAVDPSAFRTLLGSFATGVAVVTARDHTDQLAGMTASAVASVSLEPPLLVVCVERTTDFHRTIATASHFALSVLAADQEGLSRRFATDNLDRFAGVGHTVEEHGLALLDGAAAHIICAAWDARAAGDHTLFLGKVIGGASFSRSPLVHFRGGYRNLR